MTSSSHTAGRVIMVRAAVGSVIHISVSDRSYLDVALPHRFVSTLCGREITAEWSEVGGLITFGPSGIDVSAIAPLDRWRAPGTELRRCSRCHAAWLRRIDAAHGDATASVITGHAPDGQGIGGLCTLCGCSSKIHAAAPIPVPEDGPVVVANVTPLDDIDDCDVNYGRLTVPADGPAPGDRVGILVGVQSVDGPHVGSHGTVVRIINPWGNGRPEYVVRGDDGAELVYPRYLLTESVRRAPSSVGNPVDVDAVTSALLAAPDGATVDGRGTPYRGDGIIVALPEHGVTLVYGHGSAVIREAIAEWVRIVAPVVSQHAARWFGAWTEDGVIYLDVVESFSSADEDAAVAAGRYRGQKAIWHNGRQEVIRTDS